MTSGRRPLLFLLVIAALLFLGGCGESPTTLVVNVRFYDDSKPLAPGDYYLYWRLIPQDGTGTPSWSNEAEPLTVTDPEDNDLYYQVLLPDDAVLTDASDLYMFDAYLYDTDIGGSITPETDAERVTLPAVVNLSPPPYYVPSSHQLANITITSGTQRHLDITLYPNY